MAINWEKNTLEKFERLIGKVPVFLRDIARDKVTKKAESLVSKDGRAEIGEKDMVDAFFAETPFGFHGPMKNDMRECGIDYAAYGHEQ
jgi:hypothetical protein